MHWRDAVQIRFLLLTLILAVGSVMFTACGGGSSSSGVGGTGPVTFKVNGEAVSMEGVFTVFKQPSGRQTPSLAAQGSGRWKRLYIDMFYDWPPPTIPYDASSSQPGIGLLDNQDNDYESTTPSSYSFVIESVSGNRVKGTFSFQLGSSIIVTDGRFDVPLEFKDAP